MEKENIKVSTSTGSEQELSFPEYNFREVVQLHLCVRVFSKAFWCGYFAFISVCVRFTGYRITANNSFKLKSETNEHVECLEWRIYQ